MSNRRRSSDVPPATAARFSPKQIPRLSPVLWTKGISCRELDLHHVENLSDDVPHRGTGRSGSQRCTDGCLTRSTPLGGRVQASEDATEPDEGHPVAVHQPEVLDHDDHHAEYEERHHQVGHPHLGHLHLGGDRWGVARRCVHTLFVLGRVGDPLFARSRAFRGRTSGTGLSLRRSHGR